MHYKVKNGLVINSTMEYGMAVQGTNNVTRSSPTDNTKQRTISSENASRLALAVPKQQILLPTATSRYLSHTSSLPAQGSMIETGNFPFHVVPELQCDSPLHLFHLRRRRDQSLVHTHHTHTSQSPGQISRFYRLTKLQWTHATTLWQVYK